MMIPSFADELIKLGSPAHRMRLALLPSNSIGNLVNRTLRTLITKRAMDIRSAPNSGADPLPPSDLINPADINTRLPATSSAPRSVVAGLLGPSEPAKRPIAQELFNRPMNGNIS